MLEVSFKQLKPGMFFELANIWDFYVDLYAVLAKYKDRVICYRFYRKFILKCSTRCPLKRICNNHPHLCCFFIHDNDLRGCKLKVVPKLKVMTEIPLNALKDYKRIKKEVESYVKKLSKRKVKR